MTGAKCRTNVAVKVHTNDDNPAIVEKYVVPSDGVITLPKKDHCCVYNKCAYEFWNINNNPTMNFEMNCTIVVVVVDADDDVAEAIPEPIISRNFNKIVQSDNTDTDKKVVFFSARRGPCDFKMVPYQYNKTREAGVTNPIANGYADG